LHHLLAERPFPVSFIMAETTLDLRARPRAKAYEELDTHISAVLEGITDPVAGMATISALVHHAFGLLWTGFYRVVEPGRLLRVGPYQGALGCLEIAFGAGVCGVAAADRHTVIVSDVQVFPGHIACDVRARSEIVVPVFDRHDVLIAVLDVDAESPGAFGPVDAEGLERIVGWFGK
jgi:L-methionine (R)-S-oxide reductase